MSTEAMFTVLVPNGVNKFVWLPVMPTYLLCAGVPIVHLIAYPFPSVWHKASDNAQAIDWTFVSNFRKIMLVFLHEYFHLR